ncbi:MAG: hypothetical protein LIO87_01830, partial [Eubacterium sp.]|nr:hypothetical protein [Eubacterium sp.]
MTNIELYIKNLNSKAVYNCLLNLALKSEITEDVKKQIKKLSDTLIDLEKKNWNGIWARIITNYLTTANLGKFDIIVGNPPWVDWKNLPSGYRDRIKSLCISRKLFSGDRITGGINLNICALISNVATENWLSKDGILGFLMPETLINQQSYEGFRNLLLEDGTKLYFRKFTNWTKAGKPFKPVSQKFLTFYISRKNVNYKSGVDIDWFELKPHKNADDNEDIVMDEYFNVKHGVAATCHSSKNFFSYVDSREQLYDFMSISGDSYYIGREGIEFYPQEMTIFKKSALPSVGACTSLENIQVRRSKYHLPKCNELLETKYLHPLIKGTDITPFHVKESGYIVPFPYDERDTRLPITFNELIQNAPKLANFYQKHKKLILSQTKYNERIIGRSGEFYKLARVGAYSFAKNHVIFRDNTKWCAAVVTEINTEWGGLKSPLFQNHAVSICEDINGNFITEDEAHYICGIMNAPITYEYILRSYDSISYTVRPRIYIPKYIPENNIHNEIVKLSKAAHEHYDDSAFITDVKQKLDSLYLYIAKN